MVVQELASGPRHRACSSAHVAASAMRRRSAAPAADDRKSLWRGERATIVLTGSNGPDVAGAIVQPFGPAQSKGKKRSVRSTGACAATTPLFLCNLPQAA